MNALRALYHLVRADFLERVRRYSFLITLGSTILAGCLFVPSGDADYAAGALLYDVEGAYCFRGVYNSAWVGGNVAVTSTLFLSLFGFYLVKNCVERDRRTGVGEIIATTPLDKSLYTLGKWLSNVAVLAVMLGLLAVAALVMQLVRGEESRLELWKLLSPFLLIALPALALVAALAVFFEMLPWLRGGFGNVVYFFLWVGITLAGVVGDLSGMGLVEPSVTAAARATFPGWEIHEGASFGINQLSGRLQTFRWEGIRWTCEVIAGRLMWVGVAWVIALITALFFHRFDPSASLRLPFGFAPRLRSGQAQGRRSGQALRAGPARERRRPVDREDGPAVAPEAAVVPGPAQVRLSPLGQTPTRFRFERVLLAELRLMLKGQPWWWFAVALGLTVAGLFAPLDVARQYLLPVAWLWPLLVWSAMGMREVRHRTEQLLFSAAHPLRRQLPATWLAGVVVALTTGSGVGVRLVLAGDWAHLLAWTVGALFIPTLALALGCWSGGSKLFEVVYTVLWYAGPMSRISFLDFMGASGDAVATGMPLCYLGLTAVLFGLAVLARRRRF